MINLSEKSGGMELRIGAERLGALEMEARVLGIAAKEALEPLVNPLVGAAVAVGEVAWRGGRKRSIVTLMGLMVGVGMLLSACDGTTPTVVGGDGGTGTSPTASETGGVPTGEVAPTSTEVPLLGYGGVASVEQQAFMESPRAQGMKAGLENYVSYWEEFKVFAPGTQLSLVPYADQADPTNQDKMVYVAEVAGDPNYDGFVVTIPIAQYEKYLVTGDPQVMLPPQGATALMENTDPFKMSKQVREGSVPAQAGIPIGAVNGLQYGEFVYFMQGADGTLQVVGHLDEKGQWKEGAPIVLTTGWSTDERDWPRVEWDTPTGEITAKAREMVERMSVDTSRMIPVQGLRIFTFEGRFSLDPVRVGESGEAIPLTANGPEQLPYGPTTKYKIPDYFQNKYPELVDQVKYPFPDSAAGFVVPLWTEGGWLYITFVTGGSLNTAEAGAYHSYYNKLIFTRELTVVPAKPTEVPRSVIPVIQWGDDIPDKVVYPDGTGWNDANYIIEANKTRAEAIARQLDKMTLKTPEEVAAAQALLDEMEWVMGSYGVGPE